MKGSIRFNNEINVEVAVDPSQDEGAKLLSAVNLVDGQELSSGGGGGGYYTISNSEDSSIGIDIWIDTDSLSAGAFIGEIIIDPGNALNIPNYYHYYVNTLSTTVVGSYEEVEINGEPYYHITGDATFKIID